MHADFRPKTLCLPKIISDKIISSGSQEKILLGGSHFDFPDSVASNLYRS